jgi:toxin ParE1/3/4
MSQKYSIQYLPIAQQDLIDIRNYINQDNPVAALKLINDFDEAIAKLEDFPLLGVTPKDLRLKSLNYRMLVVDSYLVFYVFKDEMVEIRRIIHGKRKYPFLL